MRLVTDFIPVADDHAIGDDKKPGFPGFAPLCEVTHLWEVFPFFISHRSQATLEIGELVLNLGSIGTELGGFVCFACFPASQSGAA